MKTTRDNSVLWKRYYRVKFWKTHFFPFRYENVQIHIIRNFYKILKHRGQRASSSGMEFVSHMASLCLVLETLCIRASSDCLA